MMSNCFQAPLGYDPSPYPQPVAKEHARDSDGFLEAHGF
jgi:hypothetical protein